MTGQAYEIICTITKIYLGAEGEISPAMVPNIFEFSETLDKIQAGGQQTWRRVFSSNEHAVWNRNTIMECDAGLTHALDIFGCGIIGATAIAEMQGTGDLAFVFPAGINAAATWDLRLIEARGEVMGSGHKGKGVNVALGPRTNLGVSSLSLRASLGLACRFGGARLAALVWWRSFGLPCFVPPVLPVPLCSPDCQAAASRNWEDFGADPFLTGAASVATINGYQGVGVCLSVQFAFFRFCRLFNVDYVLIFTSSLPRVLVFDPLLCFPCVRMSPLQSLRPSVPAFTPAPHVLVVRILPRVLIPAPSFLSHLCILRSPRSPPGARLVHPRSRSHPAPSLRSFLACPSLHTFLSYICVRPSLPRTPSSFPV
ncbi:hypothetical protein C8R44DRAFT_886877 [Mycena epipterygia]|nr:hypothetical protein C8R44DRAFT_886877 [Mycena epipterygia]